MTLEQKVENRFRPWKMDVNNRRDFDGPSFCVESLMVKDKKGCFYIGILVKLCYVCRMQN